ncbi:hypothetical protein [Nodosilinea sp. E11]|uniref:hypothetical protein n=1 Tax=Nodosilinea sp. E11 TaxID=3037479 RepID=UPI0029343793|nr:hypothetical protein [Nodosilinea sp. E11]WOD41218.1 hypothetical protein RRF56_10480 [Nodosilinea sp. E11]
MLETVPKKLLVLLLKNLALTLPAALLFMLLGYILSFPMTFQIDAEAAYLRRNQWMQFGNDVLPNCIETDRLNALSRFQMMVSLGGTVMGVVVAQTVFATHEQSQRGRKISSAVEGRMPLISACSFVVERSGIQHPHRA